jgi:ABC-type glycerol-3-phosphate transport system substrate-binding protein
MSRAGTTVRPLIALLTLVGLLLAGCGSAGSGDPRTLRVWLPAANSPELDRGYDALVADFERQHPGIRVELSQVPYAQYRDKLVLAVQGGTGPDVMALDQIWTPEFAAAGLIAPLDEQVPASWRTRWFRGAWDSNRWGGQMWGLPLNTDVWERMFYNADLFRRAGLDPDRPPRTCPEWLGAVERIGRLPDTFGIGVIGCRDEAVSVWTDSLVYSAGGHILDGDRADFDNPANRSAYRMFAKLAGFAPNGVAGACDSDAVAHFTAGTTGMVLTGGWQQQPIAEAARFDWRVTVPPAPPGRSFVGALGGWNLAVGSRAPDPQLAFDFVRLATTSREHQLRVNDSVPALREAGEEFVRNTRARPEEMLRLLEEGRPRPVTPVYNRISRAQQDAVQAILGGTPVPEALQEAEQVMQRVLERP